MWQTLYFLKTSLETNMLNTPYSRDITHSKVIHVTYTQLYKAYSRDVIKGKRYKKVELARSILSC